MQICTGKHHKQGVWRRLDIAMPCVIWLAIYGFCAKYPLTHHYFTTIFYGCQYKNYKFFSYLGTLTKKAPFLVWKCLKSQNTPPKTSKIFNHLFIFSPKNREIISLASEPTARLRTDDHRSPLHRTIRATQLATHKPVGATITFFANRTWFWLKIVYNI